MTATRLQHQTPNPQPLAAAPAWRKQGAAAEERARYDVRPPAGDNTVVTLEGVLERITYSNAENGYTIAKLKLPRQKQPVTIAGNMPSVNVGETLRLTGKWTLHAQYGRQFTVTRY